MPNRLYNKQVTPKGYRKGGPVDKINKAFGPKKKNSNSGVILCGYRQLN